ncbi:MAG: hypothetical protein V3W22_04480 [Thermoplasmata archaeon]
MAAISRLDKPRDVQLWMQRMSLIEGGGHPGQGVESLLITDVTVILEGPCLEIRFPLAWAKKLLPWADGPGRNILCNADLGRFNLVGMTKVSDSLTLSYVGPEGDLKAETVSRGLLLGLAKLLDGERE